MKLALAGILILWAGFVLFFFLLGLTQFVAEIPHAIKSLYRKLAVRFRHIDKGVPPVIS